MNVLKLSTYALWLGYVLSLWVIKEIKRLRDW